MPATLTITSKVGPAITMTAGVFTAVSAFSVDCSSNILSFTKSDGNICIVDITAATTITATKSGSTYALTIS